MKKKTLGQTNYKISQVGLGTVQFGIDYGFTEKKSQDEVDQILHCAINNGINFIDTAREYGDREKKIGRFIAANGNDFIIATKLGKIQRMESLNTNKLKDILYSSVEESMNSLGLQKIDLLQLHQTNDYIIGNPCFWEIVEMLRNEKIIGAFGVSVYGEKETEYLIENYNSLIDFFQIPFNIFDRRFTELENTFMKYSIGIVSRSTFLKGIIPCPLDKIPNGLEGLLPYKIHLNELAEGLSMKVEEIALLYVHYTNLVTSTILGIDSPHELERNISILSKYNENMFLNRKFSELSVADLNLIDPRSWFEF